METKEISNLYFNYSTHIKNIFYTYVKWNPIIRYYNIKTLHKEILRNQYYIVYKDINKETNK